MRPYTRLLRPLFAAGVGLLVALLCVTTAAAQETSGRLNGTVTDPTGAVIPRVMVNITNLETGAATKAETSAAGVYMVGGLQPGRYSITFEAQGFTKQEVPNVMVLLGRTVTLDIAMEVGQMVETVVVSEAAPLIDTASTMIAHNVTSEEIDSLPKGRNFQGIAIFAPSVNTGEIDQGFQVNGASAAENNFYIDGVSTNSLIDGSARQDAVFEFVQEVQVKTGALEAEYGGALGGVVTAVTKSGGNEFHGEAHYYYFGSAFGVAPPNRLNLDPSDELTVRYIQDSKMPRHYHEPGGSIGGPFIKNKLWFYSSFSPRFLRRSRDYNLTDGQDTVKQKTTYMNLFNKLSFNPVDRIRTNFSWLYTPTSQTGALYAYNDAAPNTRTSDLAFMEGARRLGFFQPEQSYSGAVDVTVTNTTLLSVKAGRYYLNYKDTGVNANAEWRWMTASEGLDIPAEYQQPRNFWTETAAKVVYDITTRTYAQADVSQFFNLVGQHSFKAGIGTQKNVNKVNDSWVGPGGRVNIYWDAEFNGQRGTYGYYRVYDAGTIGSTGANINHIYFQDQWRVHPRLTLNLGLRMEKETIPSFRRSVQDYAFRFGYGDKLSPRLGGSFDILGNGKMKAYASWGRYYDWTKYDLARGTFGGDIWLDFYRSLDTYDVYSITLDNMPGENLWTSEYRNWREPGFEYLDPNVKPMSTDLINAGVEYEIKPQTLLAVRYVRNKLNRTIEDFGALDEAGNEVYRYGNPGEGLYEIGPVSGATCEVETAGGACGFYMPRAERIYDAVELTMTKRFAQGWLANASYVYSKLRGNYAGLQSSDEIRPTGGGAFSPNQGFSGLTARPGGNANRYFDLDEAMFDANGNRGPYGRLATDRPHVFKLYGAKHFRWGTELGGFFRIQSGTPASTQVWTVNHIPLLVNGRGDMGRTPIFSQTDLMVAHEFSMGESKRLRLEFNLDNVFNQKTAQFLFDRLNSEDRGNSAAINLSGVDLTQGFDYQALLRETDDWATGLTLEPRYGKQDLFSPGFQGRFLIKFIF